MCTDPERRSCTCSSSHASAGRAWAINCSARSSHARATLGVQALHAHHATPAGAAFAARFGFVDNQRSFAPARPALRRTVDDDAARGLGDRHLARSRSGGASGGVRAGARGDGRRADPRGDGVPDLDSGAGPRLRGVAPTTQPGNAGHGRAAGRRRDRRVHGATRLARFDSRLHRRHRHRGLPPRPRPCPRREGRVAPAPARRPSRASRSSPRRTRRRTRSCATSTSRSAFGRACWR